MGSGCHTSRRYAAPSNAYHLVLLVLDRVLVLVLGLKLLFLLLLLLLLLLVLMGTLGHDSLLRTAPKNSGWKASHEGFRLCCCGQRLDAAFKLGQLGGAAVGPLIDELRREAGVKADW